jgi:hypothetical protein
MTGQHPKKSEDSLTNLRFIVYQLPLLDNNKDQMVKQKKKPHIIKVK